MVDDDTQTTRVFTDAASSIGAELTAIETPEQAARRIRDERFETIFADPSLAQFSRQGFRRLVRTSRFNSQTPIVLLSTARAGTVSAEEAAAGVSTMGKPSRSADLLPYLNELKRKLMTDRRKNRRLPFRISVVSVQGMKRLKATSVNLSATGILLEMSSILQCGDEVELSFPLASQEPIFHGFARVVRLENPSRAVLAFLNLGGSEHARLRRFVEAHLPALS